MLSVEAYAKLVPHLPGSAGEINVDPSAASWYDLTPWQTSLHRANVRFALAPWRNITVQLGLDWALPSYYLLHIHVVTDESGRA